MNFLWRCSPFCRLKKRIRKDKEKPFAAGDSEKQRAECSPQKCFICGSIDNLIAKCLKPPKDNKK